jgi:von Willebrand factor type A domain
MIGSLEFLAPWAGLLVLLALVPLAALALGERRVRRVRAVLRLGAPARESVGWRVLALVGVVALLALAAMQPVIRHRSSLPGRADAAVFVVVDTSESMSARSGPRAPTRLAQAQRVALAVGASLGGIPLGVATFTDRVLPNLFPTADRAVFDSTVRSLTSNTPPPREVSRVATSFGALREIQPSGFFSPAERTRALLVISDGESDPFDAAAVARTLATPRTVHLIVVRVGAAADRLYRASGKPGGAYRADPADAQRAVSQLVAATGGSSFTSAAGVAAALHRVLGSGHTTHVQRAPTTRSLGAYLALASLFPLVLVLLTLPRASATLRATRRLL